MLAKWSLLTDWSLSKGLLPTGFMVQSKLSQATTLGAGDKLKQVVFSTALNVKWYLS